MAWLIERFTPLLVSQARYRLGPRLRTLYDPEDIVNDAWAVALPRLGTLSPRAGRLTPTRLKFLANTVLNRGNTLLQKHILGKAQQQNPGSNRSGAMDQLPAETVDVVSRAVRRELHWEVLRRVDQLPPEDREILILRAVEQHPVQDIAAELGLRPNTVAVRYRRALEKARQLLPADVVDELVPA